MKYKLARITAVLGIALMTGCSSDVSDESADTLESAESMDTASSSQALWGRRGRRNGAVVLDWVEQSFDVVRTVPVGTPAAGRLYAMTFAAMHDAVNGINRRWGLGYEHAIVPPRGAPFFGNRKAAAAAAAHAVLIDFVPSDNPELRHALDDAFEKSLRRLRFGVYSGIVWGQYVGAQVLAARANDGTQEAQTVAPDPIDPTEPGVFRQAFDRRYANMTPFAIQDGTAHVLNVGPLALSSSEYADSVRRVFEEGSDQDTDSERHEIALQWNTPGGTVRPTGSAIQAAVALARVERTDRSVSRTARLFALIGMAVADTLIPIWDDKSRYFFWRPKPAIQRADEDNNPATPFDEGFQTRFGSTGGSPEYPSGQSAFVSAVATVLEGFYDDEHLSWCFGSDQNPSGRCYDSAREMADEGGDSRVFQGVHYPFTVVASRPVGNGVGLEVVTTALQPIH